MSIEEIDFLKWVGTNMPYKEIAATLKISPRQLDYIREALFRQLNVKSRVELAIIAYNSGFGHTFPMSQATL